MPGLDRQISRHISVFEHTMHKKIEVQEAHKLLSELVNILKEENSLEYFASPKLMKWVDMHDMKKLEKKLVKFQTMHLALGKLSTDEKKLLNLHNLHEKVRRKLNKLIRKFNDNSFEGNSLEGKDNEQSS